MTSHESADNQSRVKPSDVRLDPNVANFWFHDKLVFVLFFLISLQVFEESKLIRLLRSSREANDCTFSVPSFSDVACRPPDFVSEAGVLAAAIE